MQPVLITVVQCGYAGRDTTVGGVYVVHDIFEIGQDTGAPDGLVIPAKLRSVAFMDDAGDRVVAWFADDFDYASPEHAGKCAVRAVA